jgi:hypothetical protein
LRHHGFAGMESEPTQNGYCKDGLSLSLRYQSAFAVQGRVLGQIGNAIRPKPDFLTMAFWLVKAAMKLGIYLVTIYPNVGELYAHATQV